MEQAPQLMVLFRSLISLLLSVVAYFIKQLHTDFKRMEKDLVEVKTMALLIKTEFKSSSDLLNQKVDYLEHRVQKLEMLCIHEHQKNNKKNVSKRWLGNCTKSDFEYHDYLETPKTERLSIVNRCLHRT